MKRNTGYGSDRDGFAPAGRIACSLASTLVLVGAFAAPATAQLGSTATVTGKAGDAEVQAQATDTTEMEAPRPSLAVSQRFSLDTSKGSDADNADGGDTVSVTVTVTNNGNFPVGRVVVDETTVTIGDDEITLEPANFDPSSEDIGTGDSATFTATLTLSDEQVYRAVAGNGISVTAGVTGQAAGSSVTASAEPGNIVVAGNPQLAIVTTSVLEKAEGNQGEAAETGDSITYRYTVENVGNVSVADVAVTVDLAGKTLQSTGSPDLGVDPFEIAVTSGDPLGLSNDDPATAGVYENLGPGGVVEFTHVHVVTQEEFEAQ